MPRDRFAPSPTGALHLGTAFSAMLAHDMARAEGGGFVLRIEDVDRARCRPEHARAIEEDLRWLGIDWDEPPLYQSGRAPSHAAALARLAEAGLTYACVCTRREIAEASSAPQEGAPADGPDGTVYPGTCRGADVDRSRPHALRLDMRRAIAALGGGVAVRRLGFAETGAGPGGETGRQPLDPDWLVRAAGDIVVLRKDGSFAYHLAVVVDDAFQRITRVTRGRDLFSSTPVHVVLQALLGLPTPAYHHHRLIRDDGGRRLAKRDDARAIAALRAQGWTPADVRRAVGLD
ncbi:MAG TPA: tRNA glutamyl-Q(34) synthetase GluQRS [Thermohalobaculum sp.]|nr:tRNA glutamyl-Q(34) synthetase GluQRS [Thermohalobaculum sp.]